MSHITSIRRTATVIGATGLIAIALAGPARAQPDAGTGGTAEQHCSVSCYPGPDNAAPVAATPASDNNGIEVFQLGAGLLAGLALAGAGIAVASRRNQGHVAHPA